MKSKQNDAELIAEAYANVEPIEVQEEMLGALASGAGAVARGAGAAARGVGKALVSEPAKKIYKGAGTALKKTAETVGGAAIGATAGAAEGVAKAVGGIAQGAVEGVTGGVQGAIDGATGGIGKATTGAVEGLAGSIGSEDGEHKDAPMRNITKRKMSREELQASIQTAEGVVGIKDGERKEGKHTQTSTELKQRLSDAIKEGDLDDGDAMAIRQMERKTKNVEDAEIVSDTDGAEHDAPVEVDMTQNPDPESLEVSKEVEEPAMDLPPITIGAVMPEPMNHQDRSEMEMAKAELYKLEKYSFKLGQMLDLLPSLEGWTASKITKAADYLSSVYHKLDYDLNGDNDGIHSEDHEGH